MRPLTVAFGIVLLVVGVSTSIWSARYAPWAPQRRVAENSVVKRLQEVKAGADRRAGRLSKTAANPARNSDPSIDPRPPIAAKAPFPKAVIGNRDYVFGCMAINEEKKHVFRIENKGQARLLLANGPTECKCTISSLSNYAVVPGGFADIEVTWRPREADSAFEKTAIIWTNDPKLSEIHFSVAGKVAPPLEVSPRTWNAGNVTGDQDGKAVGTIASELVGNFTIVSVVPADPNITVHYQPMSQRDLTRAKLSAGYEFTVTVRQGVRLGRFRSRIKVLTSLPGADAVEIEVTAVRSGPIRFLPAVPLVGFGYWNSEKLLLNLGRFPHENGSKTALPALVSAMKDKFQLLGVKSSDSFVKVSLEPNPAISNGTQQGVRFVFEVPPGAPPVNYMTRKPVHVTVHTNHPHLKDLDFDLQFVSR